MLFNGARLQKTGSRSVASKTRRRRALPCARSCEFRAARCCEWLGATAAPRCPRGLGGAVAPNATTKTMFCLTKIDTRLTTETRRDILVLLGHGQMSTATTMVYSERKPALYNLLSALPCGGLFLLLDILSLFAQGEGGNAACGSPREQVKCDNMNTTKWGQTWRKLHRNRWERSRNGRS